MADPIDIHVGQIVRAKRRLRGLSQADLGAALGVSFQQVQKYERGANRVSCSMLARIAETLASPYDDFFPARGDAGDLVSGLGDVSEFASTVGGLQLARCWGLLDNDERAALVHVAIVMAGSDPEVDRRRLLQDEDLPEAAAHA